MVKINGKVGLACKERVCGESLVQEPYNAHVVKDLICR